MGISGVISFAARFVASGLAALGLAALGLAGASAVPAWAQDCLGHPDAIGTSRVIAIAPGDYPRVGTMQYPQTLPLNDHEVVLTFDDGPLPPYSTQILDTLAAQCVKVTYFTVGEMARNFPAVVRRMRADGHTIGTHSEHHPTGFDRLPLDRLRHEIDDGIADVGAAAGDPAALAPFFRVPGLARSDLVEQELAARSLIVFSADTVADDWHRHITPARIIELALSRLQAKGRGVLLLHDIHPWTAIALPGLLKQLKDHGFRIVQVVPAGPDHPETMAAGLPQMSVQWSMAAQDVIDDSGGTPGWPSFESSALAGRIALPVPAVDSFDVDYTLTPRVSTGEIETAAATPEAVGGVAPPWPHESKADESNPDVTASTPQLAAPSVADIGWPVDERNGTDQQFGAPKSDKRHSNSRHLGAPSSADAAPSIDHGDVRQGGPQGRHDIGAEDHAHARPVAHRRGRAPAADRQQHADLVSTIATLFTPTPAAMAKTR